MAIKREQQDWRYSDPITILRTVLSREPYDPIKRQSQVVQVAAVILPGLLFIIAAFFSSGALQGAIFMVGSAFLGVQLAEPFRQVGVRYRRFAEEAEEQMQTLTQLAGVKLRFRVCGSAVMLGTYKSKSLLKQRTVWLLRFFLPSVERSFDRWIDETIPAQILGVDTEVLTSVFSAGDKGRYSRWRSRCALRKAKCFMKKLDPLIRVRYKLSDNADVLAPVDFRIERIGKEAIQFPTHQQTRKFYMDQMKRIESARQAGEGKI